MNEIIEHAFFLKKQVSPNKTNFLLLDTGEDLCGDHRCVAGAIYSDYNCFFKKKKKPKK